MQRFPIFQESVEGLTNYTINEDASHAFIDALADVNTITIRDWFSLDDVPITPIMSLCLFNGSLEQIQCVTRLIDHLIARGADINLSNQTVDNASPYRPLDMIGNKDILFYMLQKPELELNYSGNTILIRCIKFIKEQDPDYIPLLLMLIKKNAPINILLRNGDTPLSLICKNSAMRKALMVEFLEHGGNPNGCAAVDIVQHEQPYHDLLASVVLGHPVMKQDTYEYPIDILIKNKDSVTFDEFTLLLSQPGLIETPLLDIFREKERPYHIRLLQQKLEHLTCEDTNWIQFLKILYKHPTEANAKIHALIKLIHHGIVYSIPALTPNQSVIPLTVAENIVSFLI